MGGAIRPCPCGSGQPSRWVDDARGIPLARTCAVCHDEKMKRYRSEVLTNPDYAASEPIEGE
jgi:hypothetical protein